jgi:predicted amidohydrolase YtcJ
VRRHIWAAALLLVATPLAARRPAPPPPPPPTESLIDNINGYAVEEGGRMVRFSGLLIGPDGRVAKLLQSGDDRPQSLRFRLNGGGRTLIPGFVSDRGHLMLTGLQKLLDKTSETRAAERLRTALKNRGRGALPREYDAAVVIAQGDALSRGVTTTTDSKTTTDDWLSFRRVGDAGHLRTRIVAYADGIEPLLSVAGPQPTPWLYGGRLQMIGASLVTDGKIEDSRLRNWMSRAAMDGFQVSVEAQSDAGVGQTQSALEELTQTYQGDRRWRVFTDHAAASAPLQRLATLGAIVASPAEPAEPFARIAARLRSGTSPADALAAETALPARAAFAEKELGSLLPGHQADFLLIDRDIFLPGADVAAAQSLETWVGGVRIWSVSTGEARQ